MSMLKFLLVRFGSARRLTQGEVEGNKAEIEGLRYFG